MKAALKQLRVVIDARQHELKQQGDVEAARNDFLLNAMQQVYYMTQGDWGPHAEVFVLTRHGIQMRATTQEPPAESATLLQSETNARVTALLSLVEQLETEALELAEAAQALMDITSELIPHQWGAEEIRLNAALAKIEPLLAEYMGVNLVVDESLPPGEAYLTDGKVRVPIVKPVCETCGDEGQVINTSNIPFSPPTIPCPDCPPKESSKTS